MVLTAAAQSPFSSALEPQLDDRGTFSPHCEPRRRIAEAEHTHSPLFIVDYSHFWVMPSRWYKHTLPDVDPVEDHLAARCTVEALRGSRTIEIPSLCFPGSLKAQPGRRRPPD